MQHSGHIKLTIFPRPELHAQPDPLDNSVEPHNAWVVGAPVVRPIRLPLAQDHVKLTLWNRVTV